MIEFIWYHTEHHIFPMCDKDAYDKSSVAKKLKGIGTDNSALDTALMNPTGEISGNANQVDEGSAQKRRRKKDGHEFASLIFKKLQPFRLLKEFSELWGMIATLVTKTKLQESVVLQLTERSLKSMSVVGTDQIQYHAVPLLSAVLLHEPSVSECSCHCSYIGTTHLIVIILSPTLLTLWGKQYPSAGKQSTPSGAFDSCTVLSPPAHLQGFR